MATRESENPVQFDELYRDLILDHYRNPRNQGILEEASAVAEGVNPNCGDELRLGITVENGIVQEVRFVGQGCSISQASSSMMTQQIRGHSLHEIKEVASKVQQMLTNDDFNVDEDSVEIGDLESLQGVAKFPVRVKCALLAWKVLEQALGDTIKDQSTNESIIQTRTIETTKGRKGR